MQRKKKHIYKFVEEKGLRAVRLL